MLDSFIVVPSTLDSFYIVAVTASFGEGVSGVNCDMVIQQRDQNFAVINASSIPYTHTAGDRVVQFAWPQPGESNVQVTVGNTLNVNVVNGGTPPDGEAAGYTVTLTLQANSPT
jgi:hypothetical protein